MADRLRSCPDCYSTSREVAGELASELDRRNFLKRAGGLAALATVSAVPTWAIAKDTTKVSEPESLVKVLYEGLSDEQKSKICFDWDFVDPQRGLLRTRVANNWNVTEPEIISDFYTKDQQALIREIFEGIIQPDWHDRIDKQLEDDAGGYGNDQSIAIFGRPGEGKFEFVMTGRHMTLRCDGNSADHVAFGGPIFYGHAAESFNEGPNHPGNVFWPQAVAANNLFQMLDGRQRKLALVEKLPSEEAVAFRGAGAELPGIPASELSSDQHDELKRVLQTLIEPYRQADRDEVAECLKAQGGLEKCSLAFYKEGDIGNDQVWDCWRLEGPSFVWYFRGSPHVHVWANIASDPSVKLNA